MMFRHTLPPLLLISCLLVSCAGKPVTLGNTFNTTSGLDSAAGVFLMEHIRFPEGVAYEFSARVVRTTPFWFQVWRPVFEAEKAYQLVWQYRLVPEEAPRLYKVRLHTKDEVVLTQAGDRLAVWSEESVNPVGFTFNSAKPSFRYSVGNNAADMFVGKEVTFVDVPFPFYFSVGVTVDDDVSRYYSLGTGTLIPTTIPPTVGSTISSIPVNDGTIQYVGSSLTRRQSALTENAQGIYLFSNIMFEEAGVVTELFGHFERKESVLFQVWRPISGVADKYMLVGQVRVEPNMVPRAERFALDSSTYIFTQPGDVLGMTIQTSTCALGYTFTSDQTKGRPLTAKYATQPYPGFNVTVNSFGMPYDFAVGAKYDTNPDPAVYGTPRPIIVTTPPPTTTTQPTTTRATTTPPIFPPNILLVGRTNTRPTARYVASGARKTFLLWDLKFTEQATVTAFWGYFVNPGRIQFQVWRKVTEESTTFKLVGFKDFESRMSKDFLEIRLDQSEQFEVLPGDCLGFSNAGDVSVLGYHFEAVNLYYSDNVMTTSIDGVMPFEALSFPYNFALSAQYKAGHSTTTASTTTTTTTAGPASTTTAATVSTTTTKAATPAPSTPKPAPSTPAPAQNTSAPAPSTPAPTPVTPTTDTTPEPSRTPSMTTKPTESAVNPKLTTQFRPPNYAESVSYAWIADPTWILALFIWLVILTLLFLILCLVVTCRNRTSTDSQRSRKKYNSFTNPISSSRRPNSYGQWGSMKGNEGMDYFNPTIARTGSRNSSNGNGADRAVSGEATTSSTGRLVPSPTQESAKTHM